MNVSRWSLAVAWLTIFFVSPLLAPNLKRGAANSDNNQDLSDGVKILLVLFQGTGTFDCEDAADANDSGLVDLSDGLFIFNHLFQGGPAMPAPTYPNCGVDPTEDGLGCDTYDNCDQTPPDETAPQIINLEVTDVTQEGATISFETDEPSTATLDYGTSDAYGTSDSSDTLAMAHSFTVSSLDAGTEYHFEISATDEAGNTALSGDTIFSTVPEATGLSDVGHVLNRVTYGPTKAAIDQVEAMGIRNYLEEQLDPASIDEASNVALHSREAALFDEVRVHDDTTLLRPNSSWLYFKGTEEPPADWNDTDFDDSSWLVGATSIGYGDGDDITILDDMRERDDDPETPDVDESRPGYLSVYIRTEFNVADVNAIDDLILRIWYDDGFVAYINGVEVARVGIAGNPPAFDARAANHEANELEDFDISAHKNLLVNGANTIALQGHNQNYNSSDFTINPAVVSRTADVAPPRNVIGGITELQELIHIRGIYARRQLQAVLGEFWENHFTTDVEKVEEYFNELQNSDASDAMNGDQAEIEAAQTELAEYEFFYQNALGYFGDMLVYSAASPAMSVYLDNVVNFKAEPNENYSREIMELYAMGVDNRYNQTDIEELAKCFTGWTICKVRPEDYHGYPDFARDPPTNCDVQFEDFAFEGEGNSGTGLAGNWRYFKGTEQPSPDGEGNATWDWARLDFDDSTWLEGTTAADEGVGYERGNDNPILSESVDLSDMSGNYRTVYLRKEFTLTQETIDNLQNLILKVDEFDDGYVAYVNGVPIAQSLSMDDEKDEGPFYDNEAFDFDEGSEESHERTEGAEAWNLNSILGLLRPAPEVNVLGVQIHNTSLGSSDASFRGYLVDRHVDPSSVENGDPGGVWTFRFNDDEHHLGEKVIFEDDPANEIVIPANRSGIDGLGDALDVVDALVDHPSTREFICVKLIQKFVSDEISIQAVVKLREPGLTPAERDALVPLELRDLLSRCTQAWNTPSGPDNRTGHIGSVMRVLLDPTNQSDVFWQDIAYRTKIRTPIEVVNAALRLLEADATGEELPDHADDMGMHLFTRDEPNGWDETGGAWADTAQYQARIEFFQTLSENGDDEFTWDTQAFLNRHDLSTADEIIDFFSSVMYHGTLSMANRNLLLEYATTSDTGADSPLVRGRADYIPRVQQLVGLMLSMPQWHFQ